MKKAHSAVMLAAIMLVCAASAWGGEFEATKRLAMELAEKGEHEPAAIEYRRLALGTDDMSARSGYYWAAAYEYWRAGKPGLTVKMLDRTEEGSHDLGSQVLLLRAQAALEDDESEQAEFYLRTLTETDPGASEQYVARRLAQAMISQGDIAAARRALSDTTGADSLEAAALDRYERGWGRVPWVGGVLGIVPGLGYMYSGEYANGLRSLLLNGLFMYAMVHTAEREQWGAFAAVTFFELTWFTGSVYGGVDAAHRYNRDRLNDCIDSINGESAFEADLKQIPVVSLQFRF